jgi:hypothetical protein
MRSLSFARQKELGEAHQLRLLKHRRRAVSANIFGEMKVAPSSPSLTTPSRRPLNCELPRAVLRPDCQGQRRLAYNEK